MGKMFKAVRKISGKDGNESNYGKHFREQDHTGESNILEERAMSVFLKVLHYRGN